jgi:hypothetical protein
MLLACECANLIRRIDTRTAEAAYASGLSDGGCFATTAAPHASRSSRKAAAAEPRWTYDISASTQVGRHKHDILARLHARSAAALRRTAVDAAAGGGHLTTDHGPSGGARRAQRGQTPA